MPGGGEGGRASAPVRRLTLDGHDAERRQVRCEIEAEQAMKVWRGVRERWREKWRRAARAALEGLQERGRRRTGRGVVLSLTFT